MASFDPSFMVQYASNMLTRATRIVSLYVAIGALFGLPLAFSLGGAAADKMQSKPIGIAIMGGVFIIVVWIALELGRARVLRLRVEAHQILLAVRTNEQADAHLDHMASLVAAVRELADAATKQPAPPPPPRAADHTPPVAVEPVRRVPPPPPRAPSAPPPPAPVSEPGTKVYASFPRNKPD